MADTQNAAAMTGAPPGTAGRAGAVWNHLPALPLERPPLFRWPLNPLKVLGHVLRSWNPMKERFAFLLSAFAVWYVFSPSLERAAEFQADWMAEIWLRNLFLILLVAGGLHLHFYTFRRQGDELRYDARPLARKNGIFHFGNQVRDNMFWTLTSGVFFWSAWECLLMWAYANGVATMITFESNPVWFIALILLVPYWTGLHFYCHHRLLHCKPLYSRIHSWHHKNVNIGPWSGLAMHPVEHFVLFSDSLLYLVVASHPVHAIFNLLMHGFGAPASHTGFAAVKVTKNISYDVSDFYHQLHHRFLRCNYGSPETPWDFWLGTFHDGTPESEGRLRKSLRPEPAG